jgi:hypothetical protein
VTVDGHTRFTKYRGSEGGTAEAASAAAPAPSAAGPPKTGPELVQQWACNSCHKFDAPDRLVGPSLWDIGARKDVGYIRESILQPDAVVTAGFPPQVMKGTLDGSGFYQQVTLRDLNTLVDYLASLKGK